MTTAAGQVIDLIFGRWRSQVLAAGAELGIFDRLDRTVPRTARELAADMGLDAALLYRLLRAQAAIGLLVEDSSGGFALTESGDLLRAAHPRSLAAMARLEERPQHYALWKHLPAMIKDGKQNAFVREFGHMAFDHAKADRDYAERFDQAMTSYSGAQAVQVLDALRGGKGAIRNSGSTPCTRTDREQGNSAGIPIVSPSPTAAWSVSPRAGSASAGRIIATTTGKR